LLVVPVVHYDNFNLMGRKFATFRGNNDRLEALAEQSRAIARWYYH
jgi:hypothetical protein